MKIRHECDYCSSRFGLSCDVYHVHIYIFICICIHTYVYRHNTCTHYQDSYDFYYTCTYHIRTPKHNTCTRISSFIRHSLYMHISHRHDTCTHLSSFIRHSLYMHISHRHDKCTHVTRLHTTFTIHTHMTFVHLSSVTASPSSVSQIPSTYASIL